jgi:predicted kinase
MSQLTMMIGLPGSGKSTWIEHNLSMGVVVLSPDAYLERQYGYQWSPSRAAEAWAHEYQRFGPLLLAEKRIVWDATFLTPISRAAPLHTAKGFGYSVCAVVVAAPLETCLARNEERMRPPVPNTRLQEMYSTMVLPTELEGFDTIQWVNSQH